MGESTLEWAKRQKVSASQTSRTNAVCEDCGRKWTATLTEVPVTIFIKDLDEYYKKLSKNLLEAVEPEMVLCVFRPSDRDVTDSEVTLSVVAPRQDSPYHWRINHKFSGPAAASGCQITIWKADQSSASISHEVCIEPDIVTIKQEIKEEMKEEDELMVEEVDFDPLARHRIDDPDDPDPDWTNSDTDTENEEIHMIPPNASTKDMNEEHKRFVQATEMEIEALIEGRYERDTKKSTIWGVTLFKEWLKEKQEIDGIPNVSPEFEYYSEKFLDDLLSQFYVEIRTTNNKWYSRSSYIGIRAAIQRYLRGEPYNVSYMLTDGGFKHSNDALHGIFKMLSREGLERKKDHGSIDKDDLEKLKSSGTIGTQNPIALQRLVWLNIALHFSKPRGRDGYRDMTLDTFQVSTEPDGRRYLEYALCEKNTFVKKGSEQNTYKPKGKIYEVQGSELCPVAAFENYKSRINPEINCFWQRPNLLYKRNGFWYMKLPLGVNALGKMMKDMCKQAKLSTIYSNNCRREGIYIEKNSCPSDK